MIDNSFRALLPAYVKPLIQFLEKLGLTPNQVTVFGLVLALIASVLVAQGAFLAALAVWWLSRLLDALDGIYARSSNQTSDFGAFLDIQLDMLAYSAMIVGFYFQFPDYALQWLLILLCYVLCIAGALGLGSFENKRGLSDSNDRGLRIAVGLAEGGETGIFYSIFLLLPGMLHITTWLWLLILAITIIARISLANRELN